MNGLTSMNKMNPEIKEKWVSALLSGKYDQGDGKLRSVNGYCCLGVLCDIYSHEHNQEWKFRGNEETNLQPQDYWYFDDESEFLPESVRDWAGITQKSPYVKIDVQEDNEEENWFYHEHVADLNDSGYTFTELANLIQTQL